MSAACRRYGTRWFVLPLMLAAGLGWTLGHAIEGAPASSPDSVPGRIVSIDVEGKIDGLELEPATLEEDGTLLRVSGRFLRPNWALAFAGAPIPLGEEGSFAIHASARLGKNELKLASVSPHGDLQSLVLAVVLAPGSPDEYVAPGHLWSAWLAPTSASYRESGSDSASGLTIAARGAYCVTLARRWELNAALGIGLLPLTASTSGVSVRALSAEAAAGYEFPLGSGEWTLLLNGGLGYATLLGSESRFGYHGLLWPRLYPEARRALPGGGTVFGRLHYAPLGTSFAVLNGLDYELGLGAGYAWPSGKGRFWSVGVDWNELKLTDADAGFVGSSLAFSLGVEFR